MFVYQPTFNVLGLKNKSTEYIISWKSKGAYNSKRKALHGDFLHNLKYFWNKIRIQFNNTPLVIEQKYTSRILNVYIFYDLDNWPKNLLKRFYTEKLLVWSN